VIALGTIARIAVVATWLAMLGAHAARLHAGSGGELTPALDPRVGQRLTYALLVERPGTSRTVGSIVWRCEHDGTSLRVEARARIDDASFIPGYTRLAAALGADGAAARRAHVSVIEEYDRSRHLARLSGEAEALGLRGGGSADLDARGAHAHWSAEGTAAERRWDSPRAGEITAAALIAALPAGLASGDRFALILLGADVNAGAPRTRRASFVVGGEEELSTPLGARLLLRVDELGDDGVPALTLWCDRSGLVYRQAAPNAGLALELDRIERDGAEEEQ
jgi:hypothetical protein